MRAQGGGSHGTEREALLDLLVKQEGQEARAAFERELKSIEGYIQSGQLTQDLSLFVDQVTGSRIEDPKTSQTYRELLKEGLREEIQSLQVEVSDACLDWKGIPRESATEKVRGAIVCFDPFLITLLHTTAAVKKEVRTYRSLVFGLAMHELARHFGRDDSHEFLVGMWREAARNDLSRPDQCVAGAAVCRAENVDRHSFYYRSFGWNLRAAEPKVRVVVDLEPGKHFKSCLENFIVRTGSKQIEERGKPETEPYGPILKPTGKPGQVALEIDLTWLPLEPGSKGATRAFNVQNLKDQRMWRQYRRRGFAQVHQTLSCPTYGIRIEDLRGHEIVPREVFHHRKVVVPGEPEGRAYLGMEEGELHPPRPFRLNFTLWGK
jgi:hypothetical protein